jgi:hypothetical protein
MVVASRQRIRGRLQIESQRVSACNELNKPVTPRGSMKLRRRKQFLYLALVTIGPGALKG